MQSKFELFCAKIIMSKSLYSIFDFFPPLFLLQDLRKLVFSIKNSPKSEASSVSGVV